MMSPPAAQGDVEDPHQHPDKQLARGRCCWRFPGAVPSALSGLASGFGMGAGRFPVAVTTETTVRAVRGPLSAAVVRVIRLSGLPADHTLRVWLVVGLGVDRIVDARACCIAHPRHSHAR